MKHSKLPQRTYNALEEKAYAIRLMHIVYSDIVDLLNTNYMCGLTQDESRNDSRQEMNAQLDSMKVSLTSVIELWKNDLYQDILASHLTKRSEEYMES